MKILGEEKKGGGLLFDSQRMRETTECVRRAAAVLVDVGVATAASRPEKEKGGSGHAKANQHCPWIDDAKKVRGLAWLLRFPGN